MKIGSKVYLIGLGPDVIITKKVFVENGLRFWLLEKREGLQKTSDFGKAGLERINVRILRV